MQTDFRKRAFTPVVLPLTLLGVVLLFAWSLAQVFLVLPATLAAFVALAVALYVLVIASMVASRRRISSRVLGVSLALGLVSIVGAGAIAKAAGPRPLEHAEPAAEGGLAEGQDAEGQGETAGGAEPVRPGETEGAAGGEIPPEAGVFVAVDIAFESAPETLPSGESPIAIDNQGALVHNVVFEELGDEPIVESPGGEVDVATVTADPGEYTYYCSIPGHRGAGMEGTLTVE